MVTTSTHLAVYVQSNASSAKWLHAVIHRARADGNLVSSEHAWYKGIMKAVQLVAGTSEALVATLSCRYVPHKANW